ERVYRRRSRLRTEWSPVSIGMAATLTSAKPPGFNSRKRSPTAALSYRAGGPGDCRAAGFTGQTGADLGQVETVRAAESSKKMKVCAGSTPAVEDTGRRPAAEG